MSALLLSVMVGEMLYFEAEKSVSKATVATKNAFVAMVQLPDLSVATEARFIRFRSLSDLYSPFNEGPELLDYFPASFTYAPSHIEKLVPSRIVGQ
ncbi:hypothetical protein [Hydrogenimonas cancrithermarum]|uniref:Uncharacterized protein n=1 Tax=Hydrogenimonas cancrithermarum TaxID=2993563 RepID=A0ABN6WTL2_9BACT|nr:hypothetical protein [Hydrogenimonas cancrithermarum]BDY12426.1 hypothetical protein HCR_07380 [Hydrogenimonas cancrithermarum]